ncbi:MAG: isopentenyl-diphosphate Delta-isomerase [Nanoarchaeota archaeon]
MEKVILVNKNNRIIGTEEKIKAHQEGKLHRAFSIFIFNSEGELLLQKRAKSKYHSEDLWSNTVCGHPKPKEKIEGAIHRRLKEEMGFDCKLIKAFCFRYKTKFDNGLIENEYDCVFIGKYDGKPQPNPKEVIDCKWIPLTRLKEDIFKNPQKYTYWLNKVLKKIKYNFDNEKVTQ